MTTFNSHSLYTQPSGKSVSTFDAPKFSQSQFHLKPKETYNTTNSFYRSINHKHAKPIIRPREFTGFIPPSRTQQPNRPRKSSKDRNQANHRYLTQEPRPITHPRKRHYDERAMQYQRPAATQQNHFLSESEFNRQRNTTAQHKTRCNNFSVIPTIKPIGNDLLLREYSNPFI